MIKKFFLLSFILSFYFLNAEAVEVQLEQDPLKVIDQMIDLTQKSLEEQENVRILLKDFRKYRNIFIRDSDDREAGVALIATASILKKKIDENHLHHLFRDNFLEELKFFSNLAKKEPHVRRP